MPPGGFDVSQLGQMLTQLGQMLSQAQNTGGGPVNYDLAANIAKQRLAGTTSSLTDAQRSAVRDAVRLAELWLDPATTFPAGASRGRRVVGERVGDGEPAHVEAAVRPGRPARVGGLGRGAARGGPRRCRADAGDARPDGRPRVRQPARGPAWASSPPRCSSSTDVGVPVGPAGTAALLPENIEKFTAGLDRPASEVMIYLAAREAAHQRLFAHVGWLRERLLGTVEEYARGITVDTSRIEEMARGIDPSNPGAIEEAMRSGMFEQQTTPAQQAALARLETLLALIEGWVDAVVADAVGDRLPGAAALRETLRRRRASGGPAEQTFATIVGLELRPRQLRNAAELWRLLGEQRGIAGRDALWAHPDLIPSADDLDDPAAFVAREELGDPIAELEKAMRAESAAESPSESSASDSPGSESPGSELVRRGRRAGVRGQPAKP